LPVLAVLERKMGRKPITLVIKLKFQKVKLKPNKLGCE
jgi:hypothetical protein